MSGLSEPPTMAAQLTIAGISLGVGVVLLLLCLAWCCFCVSVCKDRHTRRNAIERVRQLSRRARRGTQRRGEVHATQDEAADPNRRPDNPQRSTPHHIDDINRLVMETIERSRSHPEHVSLAAMAANRSCSPLGPPAAAIHHHHHHHMHLEDSDGSDDGDSLLPRAKVGPHESPPSYFSCVIPNVNADNASRVNFVAAAHEFAGASAPPLPGAVPTPIMQQRRYPPYNPEYSFMKEWPTRL